MENHPFFKRTPFDREKEDSNGETYEKYPGAPTFAKGVVPEFEDIPEGEKKSYTTCDRYREIEKLIIQWSNDGTKTAGTLARRISKYIAEEELEFWKGFYEE
jgi:hypothetical protein